MLETESRISAEKLARMVGCHPSTVLSFKDKLGAIPVAGKGGRNWMYRPSDAQSPLFDKFRKERVPVRLEPERPATSGSFIPTRAFLDRITDFIAALDANTLAMQKNTAALEENTIAAMANNDTFQTSLVTGGNGDGAANGHTD